MNKFNQFWQFLKTKKGIAVSAGIIVIIILFSLSGKKKSEPYKGSPSSVKSALFQQITNPPQTQIQTQTSPTTQVPAYFLNIVNTAIPITGFSWLENQLIYSTPKGIYTADDAEPILPQRIQSVYWNSQGQAFFNDESNKWFYYNGRSNAIVPISLTAKRVTLHPKIPLAATVENNVIQIIDIKNQSVQSFDFDEPINQISWALTEPILAAAQSNQVKLINFETKSQDLIEFESNREFQSLSPDGRLLAFYQVFEKELVFVDRSNKTIKEVNLPETQSLKTVWLDQATVLAIATVTPDSLGRIIDYFWLVDIQGNKQFLANSMPVSGRVNQLIDPIINSDKTAIAFAENNGNVWLISLKPGEFPSYSDKKVYFFTPSTRGD